MTLDMVIKAKPQEVNLIVKTPSLLSVQKRIEKRKSVAYQQGILFIPAFSVPDFLKKLQPPLRRQGAGWHTNTGQRQSYILITQKKASK